MMASEEERQERVSIDIDTRLTNLWLVVTIPGSPMAKAMEDDETLRLAIGTALRAAYGQGYVDALREDRAGRRAELQRIHGYKPE